MGKNSKIEHVGIVKEVSQNYVTVGLVDQPVCNGCQSAGVCSIERKGGDVEVFYIEQEMRVGDRVKVLIKESMGLKAVLLAYFLPLIIIISALVIISSFIENELITGLLSICTLIPYYFILYFYRNRLKKELNFTIEKII